MVLFSYIYFYFITCIIQTYLIFKNRIVWGIFIQFLRIVQRKESVSTRMLGLIVYHWLSRLAAGGLETGQSPSCTTCTASPEPSRIFGLLWILQLLPPDETLLDRCNVFLAGEESSVDPDLCCFNHDAASKFKFTAEMSPWAQNVWSQFGKCSHCFSGHSQRIFQDSSRPVYTMALDES